MLNCKSFSNPCQTAQSQSNKWKIKIISQQVTFTVCPRHCCKDWGSLSDKTRWAFPLRHPSWRMIAIFKGSFLIVVNCSQVCFEWRFQIHFSLFPLSATCIYLHKLFSDNLFQKILVHISPKMEFTHNSGCLDPPKNQQSKTRKKKKKLCRITTIKFSSNLQLNWKGVFSTIWIMEFCTEPQILLLRSKGKGAKGKIQGGLNPFLRKLKGSAWEPMI